MRSRRNLRPNINIVPLLDVLLVVIVMLSCLADFSLQSGIEVNLPDASSSTAINKQSVMIVINTKGVFLDDVLVKDRDITRAMRKHDKTTVITILGDKNIKYKQVIFTIDQLRLAGFYNIGLASNNI